MTRLLCFLGLHRFGQWFSHADGPCVFVSEVHNFRRCERCGKMQHSFSAIRN